MEPNNKPANWHGVDPLPDEDIDGVLGVRVLQERAEAFEQAVTEAKGLDAEYLKFLCGSSTLTAKGLQAKMTKNRQQLIETGLALLVAVGIETDDVAWYDEVREELEGAFGLDYLIEMNEVNKLYDRNRRNEDEQID